MVSATTTTTATKATAATSEAAASLLLSCAAFGVTSLLYYALSWSGRRDRTNNDCTGSTSTTTTTSQTRGSSTSSITNNSSSSSRASQEQQPTPQPASNRLVRYLSSQHSDSPFWSDYSDDDEYFVQELPKIELHVHLDGTFDPQFLWRYMQEHPDSIYCLPVSTTPPWQETDPPLPIRSMVQNCRNVHDFHRLCTCRTGRYRSLQEMLNCFQVFLPLVRNNLELIEQLAHDFCQRQHEQKVVYSEVRYSPHLLAESVVVSTPNTSTSSSGAENDSNNNTNITAEDVIHAVTRGLRRGCQEFTELTVHQILCAIAWRPDWALEVVDLAKRFQHDDGGGGECSVVGIDVAAGEEMFDETQFPHLHRAHYEMAQRAWQHNIPLTLHAGESTAATAVQHIRRAIHDYHAVRIGHGYRMADCPATMQFVRQHHVHVEVCPTSSVETGGWMYRDDDADDDDDDDKDNVTSTRKTKNWKEHPAVVMRRHGVSISLSSDDPAVFHTSLAWQYRVALAKMEFRHQDLIQMNLEAIDAAWCSSSTKERLRKVLLDYAQSQRVEGFFSDEQDATTASPSKTGAEEWTNRRHVWQKSKSDSFSDRVYVFEDERW